MTMPGRRNTSFRVLLLGEDSLSREGLRLLLSDLPHTIDIEKAQSAELLPPNMEKIYDLVFLGVLATGEDPASAVRHARGRLGPVPIAVLAQNDAPAAVRASIAAGAAGFLPIMASPKLILHAVELMLSGGVYFPASVLGTANGFRYGADRDETDGEPGRARLTRRQQSVLRELAKGQSNKQIAGVLGLSEATVKVHIAAIMRTLKATNRTQAVITATEAGILEQDFT